MVYHIWPQTATPISYPDGTWMVRQKNYRDLETPPADSGCSHGNVHKSLTKQFKMNHGRWGYLDLQSWPCFSHTKRSNPWTHTLQRKCGIRNCHFPWNKETNQSFKLPHPFPHANGLSFWRMRTHRTVHRHLRLRPTPADRFAAMEGCKPMQSIMEYKGPNPTNQLGLGSSTMLFIGNFYIVSNL